MEDYELDQVIEALRSNAEALGRVSSDLGKKTSSGGNGGTDAASGRLYKDLSGHIGKMNSTISTASIHLKTLGGSAEDLSSGIKNILRTGFFGAVGGAIFAELIESGEHLFKTYRELADVGETFGGNMLTMSKAAADANLPLNEFASMIMRNSVAAGQLQQTSDKTGASLGALQKGVRDNLHAMGMYGMSLAEIGDLTGDYADTLRLSNAATYRNKAAMTEQITKFAIDISEWSAATGKSRKELEEASSESLKSISATSLGLNKTQQEAFTKANVGLNALDKTGEFANGLNDTLAAMKNGGDAFNTDFIQNMQKGNADLAQAIGNQMNVLARHVNSSTLTSKDIDKYGKESLAVFNSQRDNLVMQAKFAHNEAADHTAKLFSPLSGFYAAGAEEARKELAKREFITAQFSDLENDLATLSGTFRSSILKVFGAFTDDPKKAEEAKDGMAAMFKTLNQVADQVGTSVGTGLKYLITNLPVFIKRTGDVIDDVKPLMIGLETVVLHFISGLEYIDKRIQSWFGDEKASPMAKGMAAFATGLIGLSALIAGKKLLGALLELPITIAKKAFGNLTQKVDIKAAVVNVNGSALGGGSGGSGGGGGSGGKKEKEEGSGSGGKVAKEAEEEAEKLAKKKGIFSRAFSFLGNTGEKYLGSKMGGRTGKLVSGALSARPYLSGAMSTAGSWLGKTGSAIGGRLSQASGVVKAVSKSAFKWVGKKALGLISKAFGPAIGILIAGSSAAPKIYEAWGYYQSGSMSQKDFTSILFNTLGPAAIGALAGWGGEIGGAALGTAVMPGVGTLVGGAGGAIAGGKLAEHVNKHLFNEAGVDDKLALAREKSVSRVVPKPVSQTEIQANYDTESRKVAQLKSDDKDMEAFYNLSKDQNLQKDHLELLKQIADHMAKLTAITQQAAQANIKLQTDSLRVTKQQQ